jgi:microcystin degradation protein MlrC
VAVISQRQQLLDPAQLDVLGVDIERVRTLVVKSRTHSGWKIESARWSSSAA